MLSQSQHVPVGDSRNGYFHFIFAITEQTHTGVRPGHILSRSVLRVCVRAAAAVTRTQVQAAPIRKENDNINNESHCICICYRCTRNCPRTHHRCREYMDGRNDTHVCNAYKNMNYVKCVLGLKDTGWRARIGAGHYQRMHLNTRGSPNVLHLHCRCPAGGSQLPPS